MDFLNLLDKEILVTGLANKKSIAFFVAKVLKENGAKVIFSVHPTSLEKAKELFPKDPIYTCDVKVKDSIEMLATTLKKDGHKLQGLVHSIAFANYSQGIKPFIETKWEDYLEAHQISCHSLVALSNALKNIMEKDASVVTISISSTKATSYGYMGPIKAALDATVPFLAKSFSEFSNIRVNAVCSGPLKTTASAGIPGYVNNYLYSEKLTLRKRNLQTMEVANTVAFLLSDRSSGINAERVVVDAGMSCNHFDGEVVKIVADNL
ncbi:MAG: SDR family oxidoreductase [Deltaproteobacteria bacterium]|nr:MAG: SDR family oxidoreductase [Deltaproteobacteria bacterium]